MTHNRSREGKLEHYVNFTIRDEFSGCGLAFPRHERTQASNYTDLKHFVGARGPNRPKILVKSDEAKEITSAVSQLGWLAEPSLAYRFPHNSIHERWIGSVKSTIRGTFLQSGFPERVADWSVPYSTVSLAISQPCPIHPHERDAAGKSLKQHCIGRTGHVGKRFTAARISRVNGPFLDSSCTTSPTRTTL